MDYGGPTSDTCRGIYALRRDRESCMCCASFVVLDDLGRQDVGLLGLFGFFLTSDDDRRASPALCLARRRQRCSVLLLVILALL